MAGARAICKQQTTQQGVKTQPDGEALERWKRMQHRSKSARGVPHTSSSGGLGAGAQGVVDGTHREQKQPESASDAPLAACE
eukprot:COSAG01_NODE_22451_length_855_cov_0.949735_1_plen_81_part_10